MAGTETGPTTGSSGATDQAKEKAQEVKGQAQEKAQEVKGQAKSTLRDQVDQRSTQYGQQISTQASDIRSVGEQLRHQGKEGPAKIADQAAERIERAGSWLENSDADQILDDIEDFARSKPMVVALGGLALGFAASRFLKASSTQRYQTYDSRRQLPSRTSSEQRFTRDPAMGTATAGTGMGTATGTGAPLGTTGPGTATPPATSVPPTTPPTAHPGGGV